MTSSQNVLFVGASPGDAEFEPPGAGLAREIEKGLREAGLVPSIIDNWRDCGWSIDLMIGQTRIEISIAQTHVREHWMLQVACTNEAGLLARLFGKRVSNQSAEVYKTSCVVQSVLQKEGCTAFRWCLDDYPGDCKSSPEPIL